MATAIFDTHAFIKRLTAAGMPEAQAEILAEQQAKVIGEHVATKQDIALLRSDLERLKDQLTIRFGGMLAATVVLLGTLVALF